VEIFFNPTTFKIRHSDLRFFPGLIRATTQKCFHEHFDCTILHNHHLHTALFTKSSVHRQKNSAASALQCKIKQF